MKVALVHEFLNQLGGAERVLKNFLQIWPKAEVRVILYDREKTHGQFEEVKKDVSWLNNLPGITKHPRLFLPLMPLAIEGLKFDDSDVVLSDSSSFAKGAIAKNKLHVCYCHTPTRFLWTEDGYLEQQRYPWVLKFLGKIYLPFLHRWDYRAAQRPDFFIANSVNVRNRISKYYGRDSVVIPPPVDTELFYPQEKKENYFFVASRLEPYKKIDLVIQAFNELGLPLKVAGIGTQSGKLQATARPNIEFLGRITDEELRRRYSEARAFVFPAEEDAGIMVLEAQACGTPVIAYMAGGALETVKEGITGEFFDQQSSESLKKVLSGFDPSKYNPHAIREHAQKFDKKIFQEKIRRFVEEKYGEFESRKGTTQTNPSSGAEAPPSPARGEGNKEMTNENRT